MKKLITPVILCGGFGTRLWPLSRFNRPKQFIPFIDNRSLFQLTIERLVKLDSKKFNICEVIIVTNEDFRFLVLEQLKSISLNFKLKIFLEPLSLNTAPALTLASLEANRNLQDPTLLVLSSDHFIRDGDKFLKTIEDSLLNCSNDIFLLGVKPSDPKIGFGYIKCLPGERVRVVSSFIEKPNKEIAISLIDDDNSFWNSGIFILKTSLWVNSVKNLDEKMLIYAHNSLLAASYDKLFIRPDKDSYSQINKISIDYFLLEKFKELKLNLKMLQIDCGWSDLGSFDAFSEILEFNNRNQVLGNVNNVFSNESANNLIFSFGKKIILNNVHDLVIVETDNLLLITNKNESKPNNLVNTIPELKENNLHLDEVNVFRPWGYFKVIKSDKDFKLKKIVLNPKSKISLQKHKHRNEHWVVISGVANIIIGNRMHILRPNESTYINKGVKHQLINDSFSEKLVIIEIQTGNILTEEDIIRFVDEYGRV